MIALGAAGGPKIISTVVTELVSMMDLGKTPAEALAALRIHQQWSPDELMVETRMPGQLREELMRRGHKIGTAQNLSVSQIVARSVDGEGFVGASDPGIEGAAAGW